MDKMTDEVLLNLVKDLFRLRAAEMIQQAFGLHGLPGKRAIAIL